MPRRYNTTNTSHFVVRRKQQQPRRRKASKMRGGGSAGSRGPLALKQKDRSWSQYAWSQVLDPNSETAKSFRAFVNARKPSKQQQSFLEDSPTRHEQLKTDQGGPVNKGKGHNKSATGTVVTHPKSRLPKWKIKRLKDYGEGAVWQTVLLSKSARIVNSNNILKTFRYPIKAPECLDSERVQTMVFSPYCSAYSGIHTTFYRKVRTDGTDLDHNTSQPLDVIQRKADVSRHVTPPTVEATDTSQVVYENDVNTAVTTQNATNLDNVNRHYDQLMKAIKVDLVFMASRAFPMKISVTVVRHIKPVAPYAWSTEDKQQLLNNIGNRGMEYADYKVEWETDFVLPALKVGKKPPTKSVNKTLNTNFMQTNSFADNNTAEDMAESSLNLLGSGLRRRQNEVADGFVSGMCYILIKYRKMQQPQQFTYKQAIQSSYDEIVSSITMPILTEDSFDVPVASGSSVGGQDGTPLDVNQGEESKGSFYVHGTIKYHWGFRDDTEAVPSVMSLTEAHADYKKTQSLNIDPTLINNTTNGLYTQSESHQTRAV